MGLRHFEFSLLRNRFPLMSKGYTPTNLFRSFEHPRKAHLPKCLFLFGLRLGGTEYDPYHPKKSSV